MKKLFYLLFTIVLMIGCGSKTGKVVSDKDLQTVDSVAGTGIDKHSELLNKLCKDCKKVDKTTYDSEGNEVSYIRNPFNRDSAYCSQRYYALMKEALQLCDEMEEILYDYDYWVCGQDYSDDWSCKVTKVYELTDTTSATRKPPSPFDSSATTGILTTSLPRRMAMTTRNT